MRAVAIALTVYAAWRWLRFLLGASRVHRFVGPVRREARRSVVAHGALDVFLSTAAFYAWAQVWERQPTETFVGFVAAVLMISLVVAVAAAFMQPPERTPETLTLFRLRGSVPPSDSGNPQEPGRMT